MKCWRPGRCPPIELAAALLCTGRNDEAAAVLITGLSHEETRDRVAEELQPEAFDLFYTRSELPQPRDLLVGHSQLRNAFSAQARIIPEAFWPAASLQR